MSGVLKILNHYFLMLINCLCISIRFNDLRIHQLCEIATKDQDWIDLELHCIAIFRMQYNIPLWFPWYVLSNSPCSFNVSNSTHRNHLTLFWLIDSICPQLLMMGIQQQQQQHTLRNILCEFINVPVCCVFIVDRKRRREVNVIKVKVMIDLARFV